MAANKCEKRLKVAILGGGPGGLGAAIELAKLPFVDWELYEKKPQISETGGGLSLQPQTWKLLEHNGAAENITAKDYYRSVEGLIEQRRLVSLLSQVFTARLIFSIGSYRNGRTGQLLLQKFYPEDVPFSHQSCRLLRAKLQTAVLKKVDQRHIHLSKRLVGLEHLSNNRIRLLFEDSYEDEVDLLVAADGIRSVG
jgi:salicylate hydroxylase